MTCDTLPQLPENILKSLPGQAVDLYKQAFHSAWERYQLRKHRENAPRNEAAHRVAWSKVQSALESENVSI